MHFSRQNLQTFVISHTFLPLTVTKLSTIKYSPVLANPVLCLKSYCMHRIAAAYCYRCRTFSWSVCLSVSARHIRERVLSTVKTAKQIETPPEE